MSISRRTFIFSVPGALAAAAAGWSWTRADLQAQDFPPPKDFTDVAPPVAANVAGSIGPRIRQRFGSNPSAKPYRIAILPFGDEKGQITQNDFDLACKAQGAFSFALGQALGQDYKGQFSLLDKFAIAREVRDAGIDAASLAVDNPELPLALARATIDVAIFGRTLIADGQKFQPTVVFAGAGKKSILQVPPSAAATEFSDGPATFTASKRFTVEIWRRAGESYETPTIVTGDRETGDHWNVLYALLPPDAAGSEFAIRLSNTGRGGLGFSNRDPNADARRVFGVVLTIDGVNTFYQDLGDGEPKAVTVHPRTARKWILGPPGYQIAPARNAKGFDVVPVRGPGHSIIDVRGFQTGGDMARAFTFASATQSVAAEKIGITDEIGVISASFYAEDLPGDVYPYMQPTGGGGNTTLGTAAGRQVLQPVFAIKPKFQKHPLETIKIYYRSSDDCPVPPDQRLVVSGRQ